MKIKHVKEKENTSYGWMPIYLKFIEKDTLIIIQTII